MFSQARALAGQHRPCFQARPARPSTGGGRGRAPSRTGRFPDTVTTGNAGEIAASVGCCPGLPASRRAPAAHRIPVAGGCRDVCRRCLRQHDDEPAVPARPPPGEAGEPRARGPEDPARAARGPGSSPSGTSPRPATAPTGPHQPLSAAGSRTPCGSAPCGTRSSGPARNTWRTTRARPSPASPGSPPQPAGPLRGKPGTGPRSRRISASPRTRAG
jgi:hypothetical protein